jgi:hypothetical protein
MEQSSKNENKIIEICDIFVNEIVMEQKNMEKSLK